MYHNMMSDMACWDRVRRILDNLPIAVVKMRDDNGKAVKTYERGFAVGFLDVRL